MSSGASRRTPRVPWLRNVGTTTAYSVSALIRVDDERFDVVAGDVGSDKTFDCDARHVYSAMRERNRRTVNEMSQAGIAYFPSSSVEIEARITWQSANGTPGVQVVTNGARR